MTSPATGFLPWLCYSSAPAGGGSLSENVTALFRKVAWQSEAKGYQEVTPYSKPHIRDLLGENPRRAAAPASVNNAAGNCSGDRLHTGFLGAG